jgi:hypothetical protein
MATDAQPPRPPAPPPPPQSGSSAVAIALLVLGFIVVVSCFGIWVGFRVLSRGIQVHVNDKGGDKKEVSIQTPFGGIEVNKNGVTEGSLGLPIYPGAKSVSNHNDATINMRFGNEAALRIVVGKYHTSDNFDKVKGYYEEGLTAQVGKFTPKSMIEFNPGHWDNEEGNFVGKDKEGKTVFEIKRKDSVKIAALKSEWDGTRIELVHINHGKNEAN